VRLNLRIVVEEKAGDCKRSKIKCGILIPSAAQQNRIYFYC